MNAARELGRTIDNTREACEVLQVPRASFYRFFEPEKPKKEKPKPPLALCKKEEQAVLEVLHSERFQDLAPAEVYATLLDDGDYLCSVRTMYRILDKHQEVKERRKHVSRSHYTKPELLAAGPKQVWSWDTTKLKGPQKWTYYYLYVILDIFSRYVPGWMIAEVDKAFLAEQFIAETCEKQGIIEDQLIIHSDRGPSMKAKLVAELMADLGVTKSHSRPYNSNDNPYSEAQFKTVKYCPRFPERFGSIQDARSFSREFFSWYNNEHKHAGISLLTPAQVHHGQAEQVIASRNQVLHEAYMKNPNRFKYRRPQHPPLPKEVWINKPNSCENVA
jgi:putative transposase